MGSEAILSSFDAASYKKTTFDQWQSAAGAWHRWRSLLNSWLGPATNRMIELADISAGDQVLDIAAGAGEQSISVARRVGSLGRVLATDISPKILEFARELAREEGLVNISTHVMDGENPDLDSNSFDAVISRVGLIYFPDQHRALTEMYRVLKPGGRVAAIVYSTSDKNKFFSIPVSIIRQRAKLPPPVPGQPGPFSLGSDGVIENAFHNAGFKNIVTEKINSPVMLSSARECVRFERESFGALHQMMKDLSEEETNNVWKEIEKELKQYEGKTGFVGPCEMIVAVGTK